MSRTYTHKMILESDNTVSTVKIHKDDTPQQFIIEFSDLYNMCHTVSLQKYPLKDNRKSYLKVPEVEKQEKAKAKKEV